MNLNIQKAKIFVEERLSIFQYAGMWHTEKTRYGISLLYNNERWANDTTVTLREFKVSFNSKSITIAEMFEGKWKQLHEIDAKACNDFNHIKNILENFTPVLTSSEAERAARRAGEAYRALTGSHSSDVAVTVSAGAATAPTAPQTPVAPPIPKGRKKSAPVKQKEAVETGYKGFGSLVADKPKEIVIESAGTAVVEGKELPVVKISENELLESGDMKFSPTSYEQSVGRIKRESPHKLAMLKLVEESGLTYSKEPSKHGTSYLFEGISITFSGTMLKVAALTEWNEDKNERPYPIFSTWVSGKYEHDQIDQVKTVLAIAKETARLRAMACFNMPEVSFGHSETNFVTDIKEPHHYRTRCTYISIYYRVDGFNHDGFDMVRVKSIRYTRDEILEGISGKGGHSEKALTAAVSYSRVSDGWNDRYYCAKAPTKRMSILCEEVSYTTNRDLLVSFGLKISAERREKEFYVVNVPLDQVPVKA